MRSTFVLALVSSLVVVVGCEEKKQAPAAPSATATASAPSASVTASAPPVAPTVNKNDKMAHCPSAVTGAKTDVKDTPDGVELTVISSDPARTAEIRARAKALADAVRDPNALPQHTGSGSGGGQFGRCPVVVRGTTIALADTDGGSKITVKPKDGKELDWLRHETRERLGDLTANVEGMDAGAGAKKMVHCPSAVDGAVTTVKDTKDGVVVAVTATAPDRQKEIKARAKHVLDVMSHDAGAIAHTGEGTGGHSLSLGRCPEVIQDTTIAAKDLPNGTELTIKAKSTNDVLKVQREAKQRAERFAGTAGSASAAPSASAPPTAPSGSAKSK